MGKSIPYDKIALATVNQCPFDWENNVSNITQALEEASGTGIEMLVFPELALTGYSCEDTFLSDWLTENSLIYLEKLLPFTKGLWTNIGIPLKLNNKLHNCSIIIDNQKIIGVAVKQILANDGVYYEQRWFKPWPGKIKEEVEILGQKITIGEVLFPFRDLHVGFEICEDAWHEKERPGKRYAVSGADIIINPSASHFSFGKAFFRRDLVINSSREFDCLYLYSNLLGNDSGRLIFDGEMLAAEKGELIQSNRFFSFQPYNLLPLSSKDELIEKDLSDFEFFPRAVSLALFDYMRRSKTRGFVLSLSGGADSACCAVCVHQMVKCGIDDLGKEGFLKALGLKDRIKGESVEAIMEKILVTVYQSTRNSSKQTRDAAFELSNSLGARFLEWSVDDTVNDYLRIVEGQIGRDLNWKEDDLALQNIQARVRAPGVWLLANQMGYLLLSTSNRSELDVGYATMDGDTAGSLAPIAGVSKHFVLSWLKYAHENMGYSGLKKNLDLSPTAELRPQEFDQTDEEDLMPYRVLNHIEKFAIGLRMKPVRVLQEMEKAGFGDRKNLKAWVRKFFLLWSQNQWKRERTAPSFHLDDLSVDPKTWCRFPILSGGFENELLELEQLEE